MSIETLLVILLIGAIAGWLAGQIVQGTGFGLIADIVIGIIGAFIGNWLLPRLGLHLGVGIVAAIIGATIGAIVLLVLLSFFGRSGGMLSRRGGGGGGRFRLTSATVLIFIISLVLAVGALLAHLRQALEFHSSLQHALSMCSLLPTWCFLLASCFEAFELVFMSAIGTKRTCSYCTAHVRYWPIADIPSCTAHVRGIGGKADMLFCAAHVRF